ncbi:DUF4031 domain-containing protein [Nocardioides sp.]|uniref:DUF4031 domain-containing protein n=1 Tax=Nocardioides sp. TaxID=35761 RepID=UPI00273343CF|nr:DUF4031 domain-containing protein [Nocardioides sp.]MDP3891281.1 DUF4031 domain-containing protein [Nocardioides sp.]
MTLLIDPPHAEGHGRLWSHLASDTSYAELHAFARLLGIPERGFDRDHYDIPAEWYTRVIEAGARPVSSRELIGRLVRSGLRRRKHETPAPRRPGRPLLRPPRLRPGDVVAVVAPAGPVASGRLAAGVEVLRSWGLEVRVASPRTGSQSWLAGDDEARAAELVAAWTDPEVRAVVATRGGFGSQRVLSRVDWGSLAAAGPKLMVGFSDVTALHQAVAGTLGLVSVHGPVAASLGDRDDRTREWAQELLFDGALPPLTGLTPLVSGRATGILLGGNLTVLAAAVGTAWSRPATGSIVLLEDVGEQPYRLDRALTQLEQSGWLDDVRGVVLGDFTDCGDAVAVRRLLAARLGQLGVPVVADAPIGHGVTNLAVPLGVTATLDADAGTLEMGRALL